MFIFTVKNIIIIHCQNIHCQNIIKNHIWPCVRKQNRGLSNSRAGSAKWCHIKNKEKEGFNCIVSVCRSQGLKRRHRPDKNLQKNTIIVGEGFFLNQTTENQYWKNFSVHCYQLVGFPVPRDWAEEDLHCLCPQSARLLLASLPSTQQRDARKLIQAIFLPDFLCYDDPT